MTSSSSLFYNRRSRAARTWEGLGDGLDLGSALPVDRHNRRQRNHSSSGGNHARRYRMNSDGCDLGALNHFSHRQPSQPQEEASYHFSSASVASPAHHISNQNRLSFRSNERLPGAVLLARDRLLQRLRGVQLSGNRESIASSSRSYLTDISLGDELRFVDSGDWETEIAEEWFIVDSPSTIQTIARPGGLAQEAIHTLPVELLVNPDGSDEQCLSRAFKECSICLESFSIGDELIRLDCRHRYHFQCLNPWLRIHGECPYCRRSVDISVDRPH